MTIYDIEFAVWFIFNALAVYLVDVAFLEDESISG